MKNVLILGAGMVVKPMVDYFLEACQYRVVLADQYISRAKGILRDRTKGKAVFWQSNLTGLLDQMVAGADLVVSMLPPQFHGHIAQACINNRTSLVTTSYISPEMEKFDRKAKSLDLIFLNEIGEDPGLDHLDSTRHIHKISSTGGKILSLKSYGAGLPHPETAPNPFGYKFSWSPRGLFRAASQPAVYLERGKAVFVAADSIFKHPQKININSLGSFEAYPNRDCRKYITPYGLTRNITFFRGLLRYPGWCETIQNLKKLNLLDDQKRNNFKTKTYKDFMLDLIEDHESTPPDEPTTVQEKTAQCLKIKKDHPFIKKIQWLGLYSNRKITPEYGTNLDLLLDRMVKKMSYGPDEKDLIIVHNEIVSVYKKQYKNFFSTLRVEGNPSCNGAMARAVSLPAAIASRCILENRIRVRGVQLPVHKEIFLPVLEELEEFGIIFKQREDILHSDPR